MSGSMVFVILAVPVALVVALAGFLVGTAVGHGGARQRRRATAIDEGDQPTASKAVLPTSSTSAHAPVSTAPNPAVADATLLGDVVQHHTVGVVVVDDGGRVIVRNPAVDHHAGTHVGALLDAVILRHLNAARDGMTGGETIEIYGPPPTVLVVDAHPLAGGGAVAFVTDVSDQRRTEQVRTDFVANISHELKTPIGAISVLAEALDGETDTAVIARVVTRLEGEADRAARTIDDLMELSQLELANERVTDEVAVDSIIAGALDRVSELATQRSIGVTTLDSVTGQEGRLVVSGDRRQLVSAVGNLIENAVKYSEPGGQVTVRVIKPILPPATPSNDLSGRASAVPMVGIAVIDRGIGIPPRDVQRIFERFYRVDRARSRVTGGTGLGLSIVRHVANRHGGRVEVASEEGRGSTFTLWLPLIDTDVDTDVDTGSIAEQEIA